jgi:hypothetical protein
MTAAEATEVFVEAAAGAQGVVLDAAQRARVAAVFARNAALADRVLDFDLPDDCEPAPVFEP